jgi:hypothetical protein
MAKRNLRIVKETPLLGVCEYCNMQFSAITALGAPYKAAIQQRFNAHECEREDVSQVAARIVRKSTVKL